ncbi:hypothetical protein THAPSDRAFT_2218 [Thalassiosira pseudonana CCMP1335]|uniref:HSF-type DNA-binding domain-containing protein n=1 Tax=Thalassiosira pseudonana TaxID=35128 RepID=B8BTQ6_THAPS|nr:hypothetical protein THAPSDRAFT_2218 [Thalassiosira pseudonana CCMP1335]EED95139.1 hypothetical protein THAPSDRAFT_2218 [Thalassiosira pseudonana CCMP1335]
MNNVNMNNRIQRIFSLTDLSFLDDNLMSMADDTVASFRALGRQRSVGTVNDVVDDNIEAVAYETIDSFSVNSQVLQPQHVMMVSSRNDENDRLGQLHHCNAKVITIAKHDTDHKSSIFHGKSSFPLNLTLMLESVERFGLDHIVSWQKGGGSFVIRDESSFLKEVVPRFFAISNPDSKMRSFSRKLNRWGFNIKRTKNKKELLGSSLQVWHNPLFFRAKAVSCLEQAMNNGYTDSSTNICHEDSHGGGKKTATANSVPTTYKVKFAKAKSITPDVVETVKNPATRVDQRPAALPNQLTLREEHELASFLDRFAMSLPGTREVENDYEPIPINKMLLNAQRLQPAWKRE